jgi:hypothetical protein
MRVYRLWTACAVPEAGLLLRSAITIGTAVNRVGTSDHLAPASRGTIARGRRAGVADVALPDQRMHLLAYLHDDFVRHRYRGGGSARPHRRPRDQPLLPAACPRPGLMLGFPDSRGSRSSRRPRGLRCSSPTAARTSKEALREATKCRLALMKNPPLKARRYETSVSGGGFLTPDVERSTSVDAIHIKIVKIRYRRRRRRSCGQRCRPANSGCSARPSTESRSCQPRVGCRCTWSATATALVTQGRKDRDCSLSSIMLALRTIS